MGALLWPSLHACLLPFSSGFVCMYMHRSVWGRAQVRALICDAVTPFKKKTTQAKEQPHALGATEANNRFLRSRARCLELGVGL